MTSSLRLLRRSKNDTVVFQSVDAEVPRSRTVNTGVLSLLRRTPFKQYTTLCNPPFPHTNSCWQSILECQPDNESMTRNFLCIPSKRVPGYLMISVSNLIPRSCCWKMVLVIILVMSPQYHISAHSSIRFRSIRNRIIHSTKNSLTPKPHCPTPIYTYFRHSSLARDVSTPILL